MTWGAMRAVRSDSAAGRTIVGWRVIGAWATEVLLDDGSVLRVDSTGHGCEGEQVVRLLPKGNAYIGEQFLPPQAGREHVLAAGGDDW